MPISFHFQKKAILRNRRLLKKFISLIFKKERYELTNLDFIFCDEAYLLNINIVYLNHDYFTDIITFDLSDENCADISGEIYISVDMISINAMEFRSGFENELHRVIFHGVLHLCGYKDKKIREVAVMRRKENFYLAAYAKYLTAHK